MKACILRLVAAGAFLIGEAAVFADAVSLSPVADTFVRSDAGTTNFGTATSVEVNNANGVRVTLLRFNLSGITQPITRLRLDLAVATGVANNQFNVYGLINGENWSETGATWTNAPGVNHAFAATGGTLANYLNPADLRGNGAVLATFTGTLPGTTTTAFDVTSGAVLDFVNADADKIVTFLVAETDPSDSDGYRVNSREAASGRPTLTVTFNHPAPVISSALSASGTQGQAFSYQILASNSPTSYNATGLPASLSVNTANGLISGTPTAAGTFTVSLSATNAGGTGTAALTLTVSAAAPVISSATSTSGTQGQAFSYQILASNTPTSYNATGLPACLSVNTSTGLVSGTPSTAGTFAVTLSATNAGGTGTAALTLTVSAAVPLALLPVADTYVRSNDSTTNFGTATSVEVNNAKGVRVTLLRFNLSGITQPIARLRLDVAVTTGVANNQFNVYGLINGENWSETGATWTNAPGVNHAFAAADGNLADYLNPADLRSNGAVLATFTGTLPGTTTTAFDVTSGAVLDFVNADADKIVTFLVAEADPSDSDGYRVNSREAASGRPTLTVTVDYGSPVISSASSASGTQGQAFSYQIVASHSPASYSATGLPAGLSVNTANGLISGTPTAAGTFAVTLSATNAIGTGTAPLTLTVAPAIIKIILLAGQSNADGRADGSGLPANLQVPQPNVPFYYYTYGTAINPDGTYGTLTTLRPGATQTPVGGFGPEITLGAQLAPILEQRDGVTLAIIKYAKGGSSLSVDWKANGNSGTSTDGAHYQRFQQVAWAGYNKLAAAYPNTTISFAGVVWVQGESDIDLGSTGAYAANLTQFVADIRATFGSSLPFVFSRISQNQSYYSAPASSFYANYLTLRQQQASAAATVANSYLIDTDGQAFSVKSDLLHFNAGGQQALGAAFAAKLADVIVQVSQFVWVSSGNLTGGSGIWSANPNSTPNWWNGTANVVWPNSGNDNVAILNGTGSTVTIDASGVTAHNLMFNSGGYILAGAGTLTLGGTVPNTITVGSGMSASIGNIIAGTAGLTKAGTGTLALGNANTFTGNTLVNTGTLELAHVNALQSSTLDRSGAGSVTFTVPGTGTYNLGGLQGSNALNAGGNSLIVGASQTVASSTVFSGSLTAAAVTTAGAGKQTLNGMLNFNSLTVGDGAHAGITNVNGALGTNPAAGSANVTVAANATLNFGSVSQKLSSLTIGAGATVTFTSGTVTSLAASSKAALQQAAVGYTYANFVSDHPLLAGSGNSGQDIAEPGHLLAYALGLNPETQGHPAITMHLNTDPETPGGSSRLQMVFSRPQKGHALYPVDVTSYIVQGSDDCISWTDLASSAQPDPVGNGTGYETVIVTDTVPISSSTGRRFLRLVVAKSLPNLGKPAP